MPSKKTRSALHREGNVVEEHQGKTIDGCETCPPRQGCEGAQISIETSGCLDGGGDFSLRQPESQVIPLHVECPGDGKLTITTAEALIGGGEFTANQRCNTDINLDINMSWIERVINSRVGNGKFIITNDGTIDCEATFLANQANDTSMVLSVNWSSFPACSGEGGLKWNEAGQCWQVDWEQMPATRQASEEPIDSAALQAKIALLEAKVDLLTAQVARLGK